MIWPQKKDLPKDSGVPNKVYWMTLARNQTIDECKRAYDARLKPGTTNWNKGGELAVEYLNNELEFEELHLESKEVKELATDLSVDCSYLLGEKYFWSEVSLYLIQSGYRKSPTVKESM